MDKKFYLTTAITYTSGKPHVGNTYEIVLADAIARAKRMQGYNVFFQTGTDEHGEKIELKAAAAGVSPKEFVDGVATDIRRIWDMMGASYDKFVRTTDPEHERAVQRIFKRLYEQGDIYKGKYKGWYCTPCESFWTESQLADGKCPDCGREVHRQEEEAYFFKMSNYAERLMRYYDEHPDFILPVSRKNEMVNNFLKPGLQDLCVSRTSFKWGIPVTFDDRHVVYVWLDALTNYITGIGYDGEGATGKFNALWPADVHVIGKDIVRFHTIYWPIFLMALGLDLPKHIYGHPWLLQNGGKMSKSKGNVIYADDLVRFFGVDATRYYMLSQMPYDNDGLISWEQVIDIINSDLVNTYGNLVQRTISMANKYFEGKVCDEGVCDDVDAELKNVVVQLRDAAFEDIDNYKIADALAKIFTAVRRANKYIDETMPWALAKDESKRDRLRTVLYNLLESVTIISSLLAPFMPETSDKVLAQCGVLPRAYEDADKFGLEKQFKVVEKPEHIFDRVDKTSVLATLKKEGLVSEEEQREITDGKEKRKQVAAPAAEDAANIISIDDFAKVELKVGVILSAEKVEKANKLLKFRVQVGEEVRTIVSGIAKYYTPDETVGKNVVVVSNLKPAKLMGIESQGMLLCACYEQDGQERVVLISPEKIVPGGSKVR